MKGEYLPLDGQTDIFDFSDMFGIKEQEIEIHENNDIPVPIKTLDWLISKRKLNNTIVN